MRALKSRGIAARTFLIAAFLSTTAFAQPDPRTNPSGYRLWCGQQGGTVYNNAGGYGCSAPIGGGSAGAAGLAIDILSPFLYQFGESIGCALAGGCDKPSQSRPRSGAVTTPSAPVIPRITSDPNQVSAAERARILGELRPLGVGTYTVTGSSGSDQTTESIVDKLRPIGVEAISTSSVANELRPISDSAASSGTSTSPTSAADQLCGAAGEGPGCIRPFKKHELNASLTPAQSQRVQTPRPVDCGKMIGFSAPTAGSAVALDCDRATQAIESVVPLLRATEDAIKGWPLDTGTAANQCTVLAHELDSTMEVTKRAVLASNVYDVYDPRPENAIGRAFFKRLTAGDLQSTCAPNSTNDTAFRELLQPENSDYRAAIYRDDTDPKKIFLVFRGTTPSLKDWIRANVPQAAGLGSDYYARAIALARLLKKCATTNGLDVEIIGHSLGGGMADAAGLANHIKTTSFNPAGVHKNTLPVGTDASAAPQYVTDYVVRGEPLNLRQDNPAAARAERYYYLLPAAPITLAASGAKDLATIGTETLAGRQIVRDPGTYKVVSALYTADMPPAIGGRVTLEPDPKDVDSFDPVALHEIGGVIHALVDRWNAAYKEYSNSGCMKKP